ncbi:MAG: hypothetical protein O2856_19930 [Planctomycetota bacterium]|nr:hypothetical protein [Planctomycetota bacterium]
MLQLPDFNWWQFLFATLCLVALIWSIVRLISRVHEDVDPAESDQDMLNAISEMRREGDLTEDEYRSIKSQLMGRMISAFSNKPKATQLNVKVGPTTETNSAVHSNNPVNTPEHSESSQSEQSESNQSTSSVSLTELPGSLRDTANNSPGLVAPQAENGEESDQIGDRNSDEHNRKL